jgi:hypothetical protein
MKSADYASTGYELKRAMGILPSQSDQLFSERMLGDFLALRTLQITERVHQLGVNELLSIPEQDLVDSVTAQFFVAPLVLHSDQAVSHDPVEQNYYSSQEQRYTFRGFGYEIIVPFSGSQGLFRMQPDQSILPPPRAFVNEDGLSIRIVADVGAELVKAEAREIIDSIERVIAFQNVQLSQFNEGIAPLARADIGRRKSSILEARQIAASLGFPMRLRAGAPATYTSPEVRRKLPVVLKTAEGFVPEPEMHESDYQNVLKIIESMTLVMERSPNTFSKMPEEVLRDHYLVQLNGQYESATGETFNANGRTDILVRDRGRNIFIGECKIWRGPQSVTEALDQLLTYLTWRDTKVALMIFSHNQDFTGVVAKLWEQVAAHPQKKRGPADVSETRHRYVFTRADDPMREIHLTVMAFRIPHESI